MHADYLVELQQLMPAAQAASVISALRQDPILWDSLDEGAFCQNILAGPEQNYIQWSPANLALVACGCELSPVELGTNPMVGLPSTIQHKVRQIVEETLKNEKIDRYVSIQKFAWFHFFIHKKPQFFCV